MATTNDHDKSILGAIATGALYVLALPFVAVRAIGNLRKLVRAVAHIQAGRIICPYCAAENPLNVMSRCPTCSAVTPGSRLYCPFCRAVYTVIPCGGCGATLKVL